MGCRLSFANIDKDDIEQGQSFALMAGQETSGHNTNMPILFTASCVNRLVVESLGKGTKLASLGLP